MIVNNKCIKINCIIISKIILAKNESDQIKLNAYNLYVTHSKKSKSKSFFFLII